MITGTLLQRYRQKGLNLIPLKPRSKVPLVKWKEYRLTDADLEKYLIQDANWAIRCDDNFHALDFDDTESYDRFIHGAGAILQGAPTVRTSRGYHIWFKPKKPVRSFNRDGAEIKGLGSLIAAPPSVHPSGAEYQFEIPPNGHLPEIDVEELFGIEEAQKDQKTADTKKGITDFALRYGKSPYPQSLCGKATKVLTRSDWQVKHMVSLRCWKWHCSKCAPLLKKYWLKKLGKISFRFIVRLPDMTKPTTFLRHLGKPDYVHIVENGQSWLLLADGNAEDVWEEVRKAGYDLVAGDAAGDPTPAEIADCLGQALAMEQEPLNTRRKISHSRGLFRQSQVCCCPNESKRNETKEEEAVKKETTAPSWRSEVIMRPIDQVARDLEQEGWHVLWTSEVEAIAVQSKTSDGKQGMNIKELVENLGIKLKKSGQEYQGRCPFHDDHEPSLSVNSAKGLWHCFGCGKGGGVDQFIREWQALGKHLPQSGD